MNEVASRSSLSMYSMFVDSDLFMKLLISVPARKSGMRQNQAQIWLAYHVNS